MKRIVLGRLGGLLVALAVLGALAGVGLGAKGYFAPFEVTPEDAATIAEAHVGGTAQHVEREREAGGPVYEVRVDLDDGTAMEVEVDGRTGEVVEVEQADHEDDVYEADEADDGDDGDHGDDGEDDHNDRASTVAN